VLLIVTAAAGLIAGLVTGGSVHNIVSRRLRWPLVVVGGLLVRELVQRTAVGSWDVGPPLFALSLLVVIAWTVWHRSVLPGILLVSMGMTLNLVVVVANGGHMPVAPAALHLGPAQLQQQGVWAQYVVMGAGTRLGFLADWILLPGVAGRLLPQAYSPGDVVSAAGLLAALFWITRPVTPAGRGAITTR